jgi:5'-nucleotidase
MIRRMRILLTNDDGISSPGLNTLEKIATDLTDDVWIVAPEIDNSGASHSLTLSEPLRMRALGERHYAVKGTPTDCVIMGVRFLLKDKRPDLVLSGVNRGQNLADDITYSGTVAGAIQGALLGIPSMAMSLVTGPAMTDQGTGEPIWATPMQHGGELVRNLMQMGWPEGVVLNVNYPDCEPDTVKGVRATIQGQRNPELFTIIDRLDARNKAYYWIGVERRKAKPPKGTDLWAVGCKFISVTPLCLDYTDQSTRRRFAKVFDQAEPASEAASRPQAEARRESAASAEKVHGS